MERNHQLTDEAIEGLLESLQELHVEIEPDVRQSIKNVLYNVDRFARLNEAVNISQDLVAHGHREAAKYLLAQIKKEPLWAAALQATVDGD